MSETLRDYYKGTTLTGAEGELTMGERITRLESKRPVTLIEHGELHQGE